MVEIKACGTNSTGFFRNNESLAGKWLRCYSQQEIGEAEGLSQEAIREIMAEFSDLKKLPKSDIAAAEHPRPNNISLQTI